MASSSDHLPKVLILGGETRISFIAAERLARVGVVICVLKICAIDYTRRRKLCIHVDAALENRASAFFHILYCDLLNYFSFFLLAARSQVWGLWGAI